MQAAGSQRCATPLPLCGDSPDGAARHATRLCAEGWRSHQPWTLGRCSDWLAMRMLALVGTATRQVALILRDLLPKGADRAERRGLAPSAVDPRTVRARDWLAMLVVAAGVQRVQ
jgi:hypothetical protein